MSKKGEQKISKKEQDARDITNVKDIKGEFLYTRDGYIFSYLRIYPYNLDLLSREERAVKTATLAASFEGDRKDFDYFTFPRQIDLDDYKNFLKDVYSQELQTIGKRRILMIMIQEATDLSTSGENFEHQHFIKIWQKLGTNENDAKFALSERIREFKERYLLIGVESEILSEKQIINLCNLFGNSQQVSYTSVDSNMVYSPIPQIR